MSAVLHELGEAFERSLFERRARVTRAAGGAPSLDAVLRAARVESRETRETPSGRGRAWGGLVLAAACLLAVMKARPHDGSPAEITADVDRRAFTAAGDVGGVCEDQAISSTAVDSTCASAPVAPPVATDSRTCDAPLATFEPSGTLSSDGEESTRTCTP